MVSAWPATLAGVGLLILPGLAFLALLPREEREALPLDERVFLVPAVGVLFASWLGLVLAEAGRFSLLAAGGVGAIVSLAVLALRFRSLRFARPTGLPMLALAAVLGLSLGLDARPSEYVLGGRDPGIYVASMALIGRTGGVVHTDPTVLAIPPEDAALFFRNPDNVDFSWGRFMGFPLENPRTGRVFAEFLHLFPVFGAYLFQAAGLKGALATPAVFGVLGTVACFLAFKRLLGLAPAFVAALLLALNVLQVWFARYPLSEPMSQFLLFTGVLALAHWEERGRPWFGGLAGVAFGLSLLVRIDSVLILVPLSLYVVIRRLRGDLPWRRAAALAVPFVLLAVHAAVHAMVWSRKYVLAILNRPYWQQPLGVWIALALAALAGIIGAHVLAPRVGPLWQRHERRWRVVMIASLVVLALYAYFLRPQISAWAGADGNDPARRILSPGWLASLLTDRTFGWKHLAAHDAQAFVRLGWFVQPLGLALAVVGLARLLWRFGNRTLFVILLALSFSGFYFYKLRVWHDYFFAARRFVPVILPCALAFAVVALRDLARRAWWRRGLAGLLLALLGGLFVRDTARIARYVDWQGSVAFVQQVGRLFGPEDIVVFEQPASIHLLSLPLWAAEGTPILELARWDPDPERLKHVLRVWRQRYRNVYFVYTYRAERGLCGVFLEHVQDFDWPTFEWKRDYSGPPRASEPRRLHFTVARMLLPGDLQVPPLPELDVGSSDDFQVSGCFAKEGAAGETYRWTGPCASLYLPALAKARAFTIVASVGRRPAEPPTRVDVSVGDRPVGSFVPGADWESFRFLIPEGGGQSGLVRLSVPTWRPANVEAGSSDVRDLGVMVDRVTVEEGR